MSATAWDRLHDDLNGLFVGPLAHLHGRISPAGAIAEPTYTVDEILSERHLDRMADAFCRAHGETPRVAIYSIWSKWYFSFVLPPLVCAAILLDKLPPFRLSDIRLGLAPDYKIDQVAMAGATGLPLPSGLEGRFRPLIDGNIAPFIEIWHRRTRVSRRVLWSNAGTLFEGVLRHLEKEGFAAPGIGEGLALMETRVFADGEKNHLFSPIVYLKAGEECVRRRRVCCLRYLLPDNVLCCACPLHENDRRRARSQSGAEQGQQR